MFASWTHKAFGTLSNKQLIKQAKQAKYTDTILPCTSIVAASMNGGG